MGTINKAKSLLKQEIINCGSIAGVARKMNSLAGTNIVARATLSLFNNGKYPASEVELSKTIVNYLGNATVICPASGLRISTGQYNKNLLAKMPSNNPLALKKWGIYQAVKNKMKETNYEKQI